MTSKTFEYLRYTGQDTQSGLIARDAALNAVGLCIANAQQLMNNAEALRDSPASAGLAVVALEELAKVDLILLTATIPPDGTEQWKRFWIAFSDHKPKLRTAVSIHMDDVPAAIMASAGFDPNHFTTTLNRIKQAAFYVDRIDHTFLGPGQTFQQQEGETVLNMARRQVDDAIQHMAIYAHIYDDLAKHGHGAKTSEDLWNAQIAIARERNSPLMIESLTRKLETASSVERSRNLFG
jgi:AbiV family abortive infection protein